MNRPLLKLPQKIVCWNIEVSHLFNPPPNIHASSLAELRREVQTLADSKPPREGVPPMGTITFRYETNARDEVVCVHAFFVNRRGNKARFMRLRRHDP